MELERGLYEVERLACISFGFRIPRHFQHWTAFDLLMTSVPYLCAEGEDISPVERRPNSQNFFVKTLFFLTDMLA